MKCLGPMVDGSELPYRLLLNNVSHTWTPMYNVNIINTGGKKLIDEIVKSIQFEKEHTDHEVILQLACNNSDSLKQAYQLLSPNQADYVEINMGCAQQIAKSGKYGCYLLDNIENSIYLVKTLAQIAPDKKISIKTRIFDKLHEFLKQVLSEVQISMVTIHGRVKGLKMGCYSGPSDFDAVLKAAEVVKKVCPKCAFILNGGLYNEFQARYIYLQNKDLIDGTMAATFLLRNVFLYGVSVKKYENINTLHYYMSKDEIMSKIKEVKNKFQDFQQHFNTLLDNLRVQSKSKMQKNIKYVYNIQDLQLDIIKSSMSGDQQITVLKNAPNQDKQINLFYSFDVKVNNILNLLHLIDNYEYCQQLQLEAPWRGLCLHFHSQIDRDVFGSNVDVRSMIAAQFSHEKMAEILQVSIEDVLKYTQAQFQQKIQQIKLIFMRLSVCELIERMYGQIACRQVARCFT